MTIKRLQERTDDWIKTFGVRYFNELTNMAILTEEVGELSRLVVRTYGEQSFKKDISEEEKKTGIADEMADSIFVISCLANQMDIDLEQAMEKNFEKKTNRDFQRHKKNDKL